MFTPCEHAPVPPFTPPNAIPRSRLTIYVKNHTVYLLIY